MTTAQANELPSQQIKINSSDVEPTQRKPLRVWPGVVIVIVQWLAWFVVPVLRPDALLYAMLTGVGCALALALWWLFFSRAPWLERVGALVLIVIALIGTKRLVHESIAGGSMGFLLYFASIPVLSLALVASAVVSRRFSAGSRRAVIAAGILCACGVFLLLRTGGNTGDWDNDFHWRWSKTPEQLLLARGADEPAAVPSTPISPSSDKISADWPGFRGPQRDGTVRGVKIKTDWSASPPIEMWRRPIGPGWSSFAVRGGRLYTQEQRGNDEIVACYDMTTGKLVWKHGDAARFYESNGGPGPRATPTLGNGRVYTLGATGILNVLDDNTGAVVWSRNAVSDTGAKIPGWGISGSPLVVSDVVIVATAGNLVAYDLATGKPRWFGPRGGNSYSSPQLLTIDGVAQILLMSSTGATSVVLADGKPLWNYSWPSDTRIMQPAVIAGGDLMISVGDGMGGGGMRRISVKQDSSGWTIQERWTSEELNSNFNDLVVHKNHAYGFDYGTVACIDLNDGRRKWKGARIGYGQLVLLPDQDVLVVLSEKGELALVKATPEQFTELARFPGIEGKTWNHPVLAGDVLLVRNDHEMAAFRLAVP
ncbi:MAG TPA: PQQ-binding-like beta-propeller repeat protein [Blastocatellia bacterium]|nr:PQQ-binding-like beta-propeller repeat protein [Blastocatellia bacterium]